MSPLDRKLLRDLWRIKGQATAIGAVIAVGVLLLVMMSGLITSLDETRRAYYERYRLADVFAPVKRAPQHLLAELAAIPGVNMVEGRITGYALIDLPWLGIPLRAQAISVPDFDAPRLNDFYLTAGRAPSRERLDEVMLLKGFADAHDLQPGDVLRVTMNGARRTLRIVGLAQAPEFLYTTAPGELMSDDARYAVIWMNRQSLAAAYDLDGAFNEALLSIGRDGQSERVINAVDRLLDPYGGFGAYGLEDHTSNRFITEEIAGLRATGSAVPPIFLAVAAFLLYMVVSRIVEAERGQIGLIKAFGYTNFETGIHYFKLILAIAAGGAIVGCLLGILAGRALVDLYLLYFKFPFLIFQLEPGSFITGFTVSVGAASAGGLLVLRRVFSLTPAAAMQPPAPPHYKRLGNIARSIQSSLDQPSRMVVRRLTRQPARMAGAIAGIAAGMGLSVAMVGIMSGFNEAIDLTFNVVDQSDVSVTFNEPLSTTNLANLRNIPGVIDVQSIRYVSAVLEHGRKRHLGAISGLPPNPRLYRAVDRSMDTIHLPTSGIILAEPLARILNARAGDVLTIAVREGRRPTLEVPVAGIAQTLLGAPAYMDLDSLNRTLGEPNRMSGAYLRIDSTQKNAVYRTLKDMPTVAGVSLKQDARDALQEQMDMGAGAMRYIMLAVAGIITFGIVYNAARIAYAERARDLASLSVIGFSRSEVAFVLLGEIAVVTLVALPVGSVLGYYLSFAVAAGFSTDLYQIPAQVPVAAYGAAALAVLSAAGLSSWLVKQDIDNTDIVAALKGRE
ncbi:MAG TPA: ABC transporter permease [Halieaceae bacterium]|nr:ABC transporter permease [Halieaceae bacterium]|tara:strand:+ start:1523 stop:3886 length:2364 start_codon:yes stop_codon:yes gene_type:complete